MSTDLQAKIDAIDWYHEFDFGNGLVARSRTGDIEEHRTLWRFVEAELDAVDFAGRRVLDVGCWDGYWSFYAERRGAESVLATDDMSQNWADESGLMLARELLGSSIDVKTDVSVYDLVRLDRRFDIVLCLGLYYHLVDPFYAFAQIRHCCHPETLVVLDGNATIGIRPDTYRVEPDGRTTSRFLPTPESLTTLLRLAYLEVTSLVWMHPPKPLSTLRKMTIGLEQFSGDTPDYPRRTSRVVVRCRPIEGVNDGHHYRPPFGLHAYDERWH